MNKSLSNLHSRVRRRLFNDDDVSEQQQQQQQQQRHDENIENFENTNNKDTSLDYDDVVNAGDQIVAEFLELCDVEKKTDDSDGSNLPRINDVFKTGDNKAKSEVCQVLIVSPPPTIATLSDISEYILQLYGEDQDRLEITQTTPEQAAVVAKTRLFDIIFTDVDLAIDNEMLRIIIAMRKLSCINHETPIIALNQNRSLYRVHDLTYYGVSRVFFAPLKLDFVKEVILDLAHGGYLGQRVLDSSLTEHDYGLTPYSPLPYISETSLRPSTTKKTISEDDVMSCTLSDITTVIDTSTAASTANVIKPTTQLVHDIVSVADDASPPPPPPLVAKNMGKQQNIVRPILQKPPPLSISSVQPTLVTKPGGVGPASQLHPIHPYQYYMSKLGSIDTTTSNNRYENGTNQLHHQQYPTSPVFTTKPTDYSYMVSTTPNLMHQLTMVPDDITKHSTKERLRRERMRKCCDQFRQLLPPCQYGSQSKRIDMATLMERTVFYIQLLQKNSSLKCKKECAELYEFYFFNTCKKRSASQADLVDDVVTSKRQSQSASVGKTKSKKCHGVYTSKMKIEPKPPQQQPQAPYSSSHPSPMSHPLPNINHHSPLQQLPTTLRYLDNFRTSYMMRPPHYPTNLYQPMPMAPSHHHPAMHGVNSGYHLSSKGVNLSHQQQHQQARQNIYANNMMLNAYNQQQHDLPLNTAYMCPTLPYPPPLAPATPSCKM